MEYQKQLSHDPIHEGVGADHNVAILVGGWRSAPTDSSLISYKAPIVHMVNPLSGQTDGLVPFERGEIWKDRQKEFGHNDMCNHPMCPTWNINADRDADTGLVELDKDQRVTGYDSQVVEVWGENFGVQASYERTLALGPFRFSGVPIFGNDTYLKFLMPKGQGKNYTVQIIVARQTSLMNTTKRHVFNYEQPWVDAIVDDSMCSHVNTLTDETLLEQKLICEGISRRPWAEPIWPLPVSGPMFPCIFIKRRRKCVAYSNAQGNANFGLFNGEFRAPTGGCADYDTVMYKGESSRRCIINARIRLLGRNYLYCVLNI